MTSKNLPPVRHLPHWSRIGQLGRPCCPPRRPAGNPLQPLPAVPAPPAGAGVEGAAAAAAAAAAASGHSDSDPRVASLQRSIHFLQQQHKETLEKLHGEVEYLRRENKELQYRVIMEPPKSSRKVVQGRPGIRPPTHESEACTRVFLEEPLQDTRSAQDQPTSLAECSEILGPSRPNRGPELKGGLITSLQPLRIHSSPSHPPRAPTLQECEVIIRQLYNANSLQSQEIVRVKALLRDIVLSKRITPENYILTKAYLVDGTRKSTEEKKFPKLGLQTFPEKTTASSHSGVIFPALKQSLGSTVAERQRRTRAVQRDRFKTTVR